MRQIQLENLDFKKIVDDHKYWLEKLCLGSGELYNFLNTFKKFEFPEVLDSYDDKFQAELENLTLNFLIGFREDTINMLKEKELLPSVL